MRCAVLLSTFAILSLGQAVAADGPIYVTVKFSKAADTNRFAMDRNECLGAASKMQFSNLSTLPVTYARYNLDTFYSCMVRRGYRPDENGRLAGQFYRRTSGQDYLLLRD